MAIFIGIAVKEYDEKFVAAATAWFANTPVFNITGMTLDYMREKRLSVVIIENSNKLKAISAATNRTLEKLFVRRIIPLPRTDGSDVILFVPPSLKKQEFPTVSRVETKHWLVRGARRALAEWIGAENARKQKRRKRTPKRPH